MARIGMDVDQVEAAGRALKTQASALEGTLRSLDTLVRTLPGVWEGQDSQMFVHQWWPEHRAKLVAAISSVDGLGQSALNNASEQRQASGGGQASSGAGTVAPVAVAPAAAVAVGTVAATGAPVAFSSWAKSAVGRGIDVDKAYGNQCVDVINDYADKLYPGVPHRTSLGGGNADHIFGNASGKYFEKIPAGGADNLPKPGDIICIGPNKYSSVGHVAVVESVEGGKIHVIQQNGSHPTGVTYRGVVSATEMKAAQGWLRPKASS